MTLLFTGEGWHSNGSLHNFYHIYDSCLQVKVGIATDNYIISTISMTLLFTGEGWHSNGSLHNFYHIYDFCLQVNVGIATDHYIISTISMTLLFTGEGWHSNGSLHNFYHIYDFFSFRAGPIQDDSVFKVGTVNVLKFRTLKNNYFFRCSQF